MFLLNCSQTVWPSYNKFLSIQPGLLPLSLDEDSHAAARPRQGTNLGGDCRRRSPGPFTEEVTQIPEFQLLQN